MRFESIELVEDVMVLDLKTHDHGHDMGKWMAPLDSACARAMLRVEGKSQHSRWHDHQTLVAEPSCRAVAQP